MALKAATQAQVLQRAEAVVPSQSCCLVAAADAARRNCCRMERRLNCGGLTLVTAYRSRSHISLMVAQQAQAACCLVFEAVAHAAAAVAVVVVKVTALRLR